jgi:diguanylate cyclase (GGDEF)-like protein/PAS domain S-box-containing protein
MAKKVSSEIVNSRSLRVLIVEDSEDDALLIIRELKKGGYDPVYERVETEKAMSKVLREKPWDAILCDYKLPKFNAPSAIAVLKKTNIDIPIIIVSGTIGEDVAVECMRLGAQDYIMKGNLTRLCVAIERELAEVVSRAEHKRTDEALWESRQRFQGLVEMLYDWVWEVDCQGRYTYVSPRIKDILGYEPEELLGKMPFDMMPAEEAQRVSEIFELLAVERKPIIALEKINLHKNEHLVILETNGLPFYDAKGNFKGYRGTDRDITKRKRVEDALKETDNQLRATLNALPDLLFDIDADGIIYDFLAHDHKLLYAPLAEYLGRTMKAVLSPEAGDVISEAIAEAVKTGRHSGGVCPLELPSGKCWFELSIAAKDNPNLHNPRFIMLARNITARKEAEEKIQLLNAELEQMVLTDYLTNLYNRRYFMQRGAEEFKRANRNSQPLVLLMLDIDEFKKVNDTYGHEAGDLALQQVAATLKSSLREIDIIGRLGGEEFAVLLPNTSLEGAVLLAERVRQTIANTSFKTPGDVLISTITVSIGVASVTDEMSGIDDLLRNADAAMYRAKNSGRNCARVYKENSDGPSVLPSVLDVK